MLAAENIGEMQPYPSDITGRGSVIMLRCVRLHGRRGILNGDYVAVRQQETAEAGDIVAAGIPGDEATVKTFLRRKGMIVLRPENPALEEMVFDPGDVRIYGKVVTVLRRL